MKANQTVQRTGASRFAQREIEHHRRLAPVATFTLDLMPHPLNSRIVADGESRLRESKEHQSRLRELRESVRARHTAEIAGAGFFRRLVLRWHMAAEFRRERRTIDPSPQSLYSSHIAARDSLRH